MKLFTPVELPSKLPPIEHTQQLLLLGSCFAENIGIRLSQAAFKTDVNPFGIVYNPSSLARALCDIEVGRIYTEEDLFFYRERWHSSMHHGSFSGESPSEVLQHINNRLQLTHHQLKRTDWLILTWGTAYVYKQRSNGAVVSNCHKRPEKEFERNLLTVEEIIALYSQLFNKLLVHAPKLKVLFTVSPIRHVRDGMHANQISKATLLLAIEQLQVLFPQTVFYFPSYEIMMDELRDYRYYAEDMIHPSDLAIRYIWEKFGSTLFTQETRTIIEECENIRKAIAHKPFHPDSEAHNRFLVQIVLKIDRLNQKYPNLDFDKERAVIKTFLQKQ